MKKTIVLGDEGFFSEQGLIQQGREFVFFQEEENAYLFHLENSDVDSYLIDAERFNETSLHRIIKHINYLNEITAVFILNTSETETEMNETANVKTCKTVKEIINQLRTIPENHRKYNRIRWPVSVVFHDIQRTKENNKGIVTSISSGGCLIRSKVLPAPGSSVIMSIVFNNFDFLAEGKILRAGAKEFAAQFKDISFQTQELIQEIINEKIILRLKDL